MRMNIEIEDVRSSGKTGNDRRAVKFTRLTLKATLASAATYHKLVFSEKRSDISTQL
jgi:hypothetical protein